MTVRILDLDGNVFTGNRAGDINAAGLVQGAVRTGNDYVNMGSIYRTYGHIVTADDKVGQEGTAAAGILVVDSTLGFVYHIVGEAGKFRRVRQDIININCILVGQLISNCLNLCHIYRKIAGQLRNSCRII